MQSSTNLQSSLWQNPKDGKGEREMERVETVGRKKEISVAAHDINAMALTMWPIKNEKLEITF